MKMLRKNHMVKYGTEQYLNGAHQEYLIILVWQECYDNIQKLITLKQISDIDRNNGFRKYHNNYDIYSYKWVIFYTDDYYPNKRLIYHQYKRGKIRMKYDDIIAVRIILEKKESISYKFLFYIFTLIILVILMMLLK